MSPLFFTRQHTIDLETIKELTKCRLSADTCASGKCGWLRQKSHCRNHSSGIELTFRIRSMKDTAHFGWGRCDGFRIGGICSGDTAHVSFTTVSRRMTKTFTAMPFDADYRPAVRYQGHLWVNYLVQFRSWCHWCFTDNALLSTIIIVNSVERSAWCCCKRPANRATKGQLKDQSQLKGTSIFYYCPVESTVGRFSLRSKLRNVPGEKLLGITYYYQQPTIYNSTTLANWKAVCCSAYGYGPCCGSWLRLPLK